MSKAFAVLAKKVYTSFKPLSYVQALSVFGSKVIYAGSRDRAVKIVSELGGEILDFSDSIVIPGLVDAHTHLDSLGLALNSVDLRNVTSIEELKTLVKTSSEGGSAWVFGRGWDQEKFKEGRFPTRWDIDEVVGDRPTILVRVCGHMALLNTAALRELAIEELAPERIIKNEKGEFTGLVVEEGVEVAMKRFWSRVDDKTLRKYLLNSVEHAVQYGITALGFAGASARVTNALAELSLSDALPAKVDVYLSLEAFKKVSELGLRAPLTLGKVRIVGVKLFADGSLGARTAYLTEPYEDLPSVRGTRLLSSEEIAKIGSQASELGFQVAIHAIGDAALDEVLKGVRDIKGRKRVEHLSVVRDDHLSKLKELGVVGVIQPHFVLSDWWAVKRVGPRRAKWVYRFKDLSRFIQIALSTDSPVEPIDPWENIYAAVTRGESEGVELAKYTSDQKLTVAEALHYYTYGSAVAIGREDNIGKLEPGYSADFAVLAQDPLEIGVDEIRRVKVLEVYVDGERVYPREVR
ncbi:MAG: amidohydrolase [Sulfolobales archaeon]